MSEYLNRLKHLRDSKTPVGETAAVQTNVSFRRAIDYIEKLEDRVFTAEVEANAAKEVLQEAINQIANLERQEVYLLTRLKEADEECRIHRNQATNIKLIADRELKISVERKDKIHKMYEQREADKEKLIEIFSDYGVQYFDHGLKSYVDVSDLISKYYGG